MKLSRLEQIKLYKLVRTKLPDGDFNTVNELVNTYQAIIQYMYDDEVAVATYGADVDKIHRLGTVHNELELFLIPKIRNKIDNVSNYIIEYNGNYYNILKVTPRYVEIKWR